MPPNAAASTLCSFHEQRINELDQEIDKIGIEQARSNEKLDHLTVQVQETREEVSGKLDRILEKTEVVAGRIAGLEVKVESLEKTRTTFKSIALKVALPAGLVLAGLMTGASGSSIWKAALKLLGE